MEARVGFLRPKAMNAEIWGNPEFAGHAGHACFIDNGRRHGEVSQQRISRETTQRSIVRDKRW